MKELIEDYKRRLKTINHMIDTNPSSACYHRLPRLKTKAGCYRTFIAELEKIEREGEKLTELDFDKFIILCKPSYLSKDGSIKGGIYQYTHDRPDGVWTAPKDDMYHSKT